MQLSGLSTKVLVAWRADPAEVSNARNLENTVEEGRGKRKPRGKEEVVVWNELLAYCDSVLRVSLTPARSLGRLI